MSDRLRFQLSAQNDWGSRAIRAISVGPYSHGDILLDDDTLLGARSDRSRWPNGMPIEPGVQIRPQGYCQFARRDIFELPCTVEQKRVALMFYYDQIGKPYDWSAIIGWLWQNNRDWRNPTHWFCSELLIKGLERCGRIKPLLIEANKVAPVMAAVVLNEAGGRIVQSIYG